MGTNLAKDNRHNEPQRAVAEAEEEKKRTKKEERKVRRNEKKQYHIRKFPIWLRMIVVVILAIIALIAGLMFGYGVLGDGNPFDVLQKDTWFHIRDIIYKE
ncbi:MAG TPA: DNA-directed RNA polymerase subunit beta [Pseudogracilibacillus sp.]|nr:DNA-directed RNA polymerase subunit beta [Pseudogracilibacillus sp.]